MNTRDFLKILAGLTMIGSINPVLIKVDTAIPGKIFRTTSAEKPIIRIKGNVGLGTSCPNAILHVYSNKTI